MSSEMRLIRMQAGTGLVFGTFLVLHLGSTMVGALGQGRYDAFLGLVRRYYQVPAIEIVVICVAGLVHIGCGLLRMLRRRRLARARGPGETPPAPTWLRLHRACGWFLVIIIGGHFAATRGPGLWLAMPADFSYLTFSLEHWPLLMFPYYFMLLGSGMFHILHGGVVALNTLGLRAGPPTHAWTRFALVLALVGGGLGILAMGGLTGHVDTARYDEYRAFYERFLPFMATWK